MSERTDPVEALERISWHLNFHPGETLSLNQVSKATGLAWATVRKYAKVIETIQRLAPQISTSSDGIKVGRRSPSLRNLLSDPAPALAVYLFVHAQKEGGPSSPLPISDHKETLGKAPDSVEKMESLGWIERTDESIQLTPLGIQIAGPMYSTIRNQDHPEGVLKIDRTRREIRAVIEPQETAESLPPTESQHAVTTDSPRFDSEQGRGSYTQNRYGVPQYS